MDHPETTCVTPDGFDDIVVFDRSSSVCHPFCRLSSLVPRRLFHRSASSLRSGASRFTTFLSSTWLHFSEPLFLFSRHFFFFFKCERANQVRRMCDTCHQATGLVTLVTTNLPLRRPVCVIKVCRVFVCLFLRTASKSNSWRVVSMRRIPLRRPSLLNVRPLTLCFAPSLPSCQDCGSDCVCGGSLLPEPVGKLYERLVPVPSPGKVTFRSLHGFHRLAS